MTTPNEYTSPNGLITTYFERESGKTIRYAYAKPQDDAKGVVFILPGSSEYIEKYYQTMRDLIARGFAVVCHDWQGHGLSYRGADRTKRTSNGFENDVLDIAALVKHVTQLPYFENLPRIMLAHSMGGNLGLRLMHDNKTMFNYAALTAPMQGIMAVPKKLHAPAAAILKLAILFGQKSRHVQGAWTIDGFKQNLPALTSCPQNAANQIALLTNNPTLPMGGLTVSWLYAALKSMILTNKPHYLNQIATPTLLAMAADEKIVSNAAIEHTAKHLPNLLGLIKIAGAQHEILMETPAIRAQFWHAFDNKIANKL